MGDAYADDSTRLNQRPFESLSHLQLAEQLRLHADSGDHRSCSELMQEAARRLDHLVDFFERTPLPAATRHVDAYGPDVSGGRGKVTTRRRAG